MLEGYLSNKLLIVWDRWDMESIATVYATGGDTSDPNYPLNNAKTRNRHMKAWFPTQKDVGLEVSWGLQGVTGFAIVDSNFSVGHEFSIGGWNPDHSHTSWPNKTYTIKRQADGGVYVGVIPLNDPAYDYNYENGYHRWIFKTEGHVGPGLLQVGRVMFGKALEFPINYIYGWTTRTVDPSVHTYAADGKNSWVDIKHPYREINFTIRGIDVQLHTSIFAGLDRMAKYGNGNEIALHMSPGDTEAMGRGYDNIMSTYGDIYGRLTNCVRTQTHPNKFEFNLTIREQ